MRKPDVTVLDRGSSWLFSPLSDEARAWCAEYDARSRALWAREGASYAVPAHTARLVLEAMLIRGFRVNRVV